VLVSLLQSSIYHIHRNFSLQPLRVQNAPRARSQACSRQAELIGPDTPLIEQRSLTMLIHSKSFRSGLVHVPETNPARGPPDDDVVSKKTSRVFSKKGERLMSGELTCSEFNDSRCCLSFLLSIEAYRRRLELVRVLLNLYAIAHEAQRRRGDSLLGTVGLSTHILSLPPWLSPVLPRSITLRRELLTAAGLPAAEVC